MQHKRNDRHNTPWARLASVMASIVLVMSLIPIQGLAEARDEFLDLTNTASQEPQTTDGSNDPGGGTQGSADQNANAGTDDAANSQTTVPVEDVVVEEGGESGQPEQQTPEATTEQPTVQPEEQPKQEVSPEQAQSPQQPERKLSANLADFITKAELEGTEEKDGAFVVDEGASYNVKLTFTEGIDGKEYAETGELTYALPAGFSAVGDQPAVKEPLVVTYVDDNGERQPIELAKESWWVSDNAIHLVWRVRDADKRSKEEVDQALKTIVAGTFAKDARDVNFGRDIVLPVSVTPAKQDETKKDEGKPEQKKEEQKKDEEKPEEQDEEAEAKPEQKQAEETAATKTEYVYENDNLRVTATVAKASALPDAAKLRVTRVQQSDANHDAYIKALNNTAANSDEYNAQNTLLYDVKFELDGKEIQPSEGDVVVSFQFKNNQLADELDAQAKSHVEVTHLPMANGTPTAEQVDANVSVAKETASFTATSFSVYAFSYTVDFTYGGYFFQMPGGDSVMLSNLFMALGINRSMADVAKVEFSNPELVSVVQIDSNWRLTSLKSFVTPEKLTVTMTNGDKYEIDVTDPLVGTQGVPIGVQAGPTDLSDKVKSVSVSAPMENGKYKLMPGETYTITMSFAEEGDKQFPDDDTPMHYTVPNDFKLPMTEAKDFKIIVTDPEGKQFTVSGNKYRINENNQLEVWFNKDDPNFSKLTGSTNARISMSFDGEFDYKRDEIPFGGDATIKVDLDNTSKVESSKSASLDLSSNPPKINYTATVTSTGHSTNVQITDTISCKDQNGQDANGVLTLDRNSFKRNTNKGNQAYQDQDITVSGSGNTFNYNIGDMKNGETVTIKYSATIDPTVIPKTEDGKTKVVIGNNEVSVKSYEQPTPSKTNINTRIDYSPKLQKDGMTLNQDGKSFTASYTFNGDALVSGGGYTLTDTVGKYLTLDGTTGITIKVYDSTSANAEPVRTDTLNWDGTGGGKGRVSKDNEAGKWFTYTVPSDDAGHNYKYVVEYQVKIDGTGQKLDKPTTVNNTVKYDNDHVSTGTGVITPSNDNKFEFNKRVDNIDYVNNRVSWTTTISVPVEGLSGARATITDTLPGTWATSGWVQDDLYVIPGDATEGSGAYHQSVKVTGLNSGESYTVTPHQGSSGTQSTFDVVFHKTDGGNGLDSAGESGHARIVTVTYETTVNEQWLADAANNSWLQNHTNSVKINNETKTATADIAGVGVAKDSEVAGYRTVNGVKLPVYKYTLLLKNVTQDDNTIKDFFDTEILTPLAPDATGNYPSSMGTLSFSPDYFAWYTTNQNNGTRSTSPVSYMPISEQITEGGETKTRSGIALTTNYESMVRDTTSTTGYYPITKIMYYLTVKDEAALKKLQNRAVNNADGGEDDKTYTLSNTAKWGASTDPGDVKYEFPGITKEMLNDEGKPMTQQDLTVQDGEIYANFKLTVNPGGAVINGGNPYDITDTIDHLSIDITSIKVSPTPETGEVVYDMKDNELKFENVPDGKEFVITYRARVIYDSIGNAGDTINVNFKNDVSMLGYEDHISDWAHRKNTGTGAADLYAIKLMKYQAGNMSQKLNEAEFTLYEAMPGDDSAINPDNPTGYVIDTSKPVKDGEGNIVTFTSGKTKKYGPDKGTSEEDGMVTVYGLQDQDGWALEPGKYYFLRETKAPANHKLPGYDFQFMISEDGITHYERYIYHSNDTMSAKNYPGKDIHIKKYWGNVIDSNQSSEDPTNRSYQPSDSDVVVVRLQQKIGDGEWSNTIRREVKNNPSDANEKPHWVDVTDTGYPQGKQYSPLIELNKSNGWEADFTDLPLAVPAGDGFTGDDVPVEYQVLEWTINGKPANQGTVQQNGSNDEYTWSYQPQGKDMAITNVPKNGSIKLLKQVQVNGSTTTGKLADGSYSFTIRGAEAATSSISKSVTVEVENGAMTRAIVDGDNDHPLTPGTDDYIELGDFKLGNYTVTEEEPSNGTSLVGDNSKTVTVDGKTGTAVLSTGMASFTNNIDLGGLKVKKVVAENSDDSVTSRRAKDKLAGTYYFNVYTEQACTNLAKTIDGKDAQLSITIGADGQAVTSDEIQNLKAGDYWVRETLPDGSVATPAANPVKVTVEAGNTDQTAVISTLTNKYDTGSLNIKKNVTVNGVQAAQTDSKAKTDGTYTFQIWKGDYKGESIQRARVKITFKDGVATSAQYEWTDERTGDEGKTPVWKTDDITVANGVVTLKGLEPGTYTVHEIENQLPTGMKLVNGNGQGGNDQQVTVTAGDTATIQTAEFTNDCEELGGFELKKSIITKSPIAAQNMLFNFTITMYKDAACTVVDTSIDGNYGEITFHNGVATNIKLVGNEKKNASNLPTGRYYKIVEDSAAGWSLTGITVNDADQTTAGAATGKITTTESKVEFKNELDEGNLKVEKEVDSKYDQDKSKEFKFKVVLDGYALTGTYGTGDTAMSFTNGAAEFTLKDGQYKEAVKLPDNIKYTVTETNEEGFVTTWTSNTESTNPASGTITKDTPKTVKAKNTREYGDLEIDKTVLPASRQASGDEFTFTVSLSDKTINGKFDAVSPSHKSIEFTSGVGQVILKHGEKASVKDLPAGITYTVTEAKAEGFTLSGATGNMGKIIARTVAKAEFTNQYDNGGLVIAKNVTSATSTDDNLYFPFKVTITLPAGGTYTGLNGKVTEGDDISYTNGVAYVFLKKGQQAVSNGLGVDYGYQVQELDISDASVKAEVEDHLTGEITIDQVADLSRYSTVIQDGSNKIVNPNGGTIASGKISATTSSARYTNTHITGPLTLSKKLISDAAADRNKEFKFEVKMFKAAGGEVDTSINGVFGGMTFTQGVATVTVKGNGSVQATGLPVGLAFEITETSMPDNFTMKGYVIDGADGTGETAQNNITRDGRTVEFTNERATGPLTLSKELISGRAADANQDFTFTVRLSDTSITKEYDATYTPAKNPAETKVKFTQGVATITLKGSQSVKIEGLPTEINYSVTEAGTPGFRMTGVTKRENGGTAAAVTGAVEGVIVNGPGDAITYQNTRTPGELTVSKKLISDLPADATKPFTFTVAFEGLSDSAKNAEYDIVFANPASTGKITLSESSATVDLIGGQSATIKGLPTDVKYTVTEASVADFKITGVTGNGTDVTTNNVVNGKTGTIATTPSSVEVTNTRETGKLTVSKKLFSQKAADANKLYTFTVKLGHLEGEASNQTFVADDIDKAFSGVTFTDGVGTFTLKAGQSKTIDGLPRGIRYEVTEAEDADTVLSGVANNGNESNLETTRTQADGAISQTESNALFKNTGKRGGLQGSKTVVGPTAPDQEFTFTLRLAGAAAVNGEGFTDGGTTYSYGRYYANAENTTGTAISFKNGAATFKIKNGGSFKLENLPLGTRYTLTETSANGFATTVINGTKEVPGETYKDAQDVEHTAQPGEWYKNTDKGKVTGVTYVGEVKKGTGTETITYEGPAFENTHEEGSLRIHKVVNSNYETDKDVSYTFRVELSDKSITAVQGDSPTAYITGSGYGKVNGNDNIIPFNNGVATFTLGDKGYASITGLPAGTTYTVTETSVEGIETTWTDTVSSEDAVRHEGKGTIKRDATATTEAKNTRIPAALDVAKTVISHSADDKNTKYAFTISFYSDKDLLTRTAVNAKYTIGNQITNINGNTTAFSLADGEVAHFTELPQGIYYKVVETGKWDNASATHESLDAGMTTSTKLGQGWTDSGKIDKVTTSRFTNTRIEGGLFVYKNVSSHIESDKQKEFDFRVTLYKEDPTGKSDAELANLIDTSVNGVYGTGENAMNFVGGVATFKLKDGDFRYAMNLKTGLYFRAMEVNDSNFNVATSTSGTKVEQGVITYKENNQDKQWGPSTGEQGQIPNSGNATARITNNRKAGNLKVEKKNKANANTDEEFFFTVELSDKTINGTFGDMVFNNGTATFTLKVGQSKSTEETDAQTGQVVGTLPVGVRYKVTERNAQGYSTSWENETYANDTDGINDTPTKYSYQYNQTWTSGEDNNGLPLYHEGTETKTITWTDAVGTHTTTVFNPEFNYQYGEEINENTGGANNSMTLGNHATEQGWRETDENGKPLQNSTLQVSEITDNNGVPNTDRVTFVNDRQTASIVLYKKVDSGLASDLTKKFHFHLQLLDSVPADNYQVTIYKQNVTNNNQGGQTISYTPDWSGAVNFNDSGIATVVGKGEGFDLSHMEHVVISGLPLGTRYVVTEDADNDFDTSDSGATGRAGYGEGGERLLISDEVRLALPEGAGNLPDARSRSGYNNTRKTGELEVRKTVVSDLASDKEATYRFNIQLADNSYEAIYSKYKFDPVIDDWGQVVYDVIAGYDETQWVEDEYDPTVRYYKPIYDTTNGQPRGEYVADLYDQVKFSGGKLYQWDGNALGQEGIELKDGQFAHFYKVAPNEWSPQPGEIAYVPMDKDGTNGDSAKALPRGVGYTVTETENNGLTTSWAGTTTEDGKSATGTISTNALAVADCTNTREGGNLTVSKELISEAAADKSKVFDFTIRLYSDAQHATPLALSGKYGDMTFSNGVAVVQIVGGNSATATGLPNDTYYTVTEASATGFTLEGVTVNGTDTDNNKEYSSTTTDDEGHQTTTTESGGEGQILSTTPSTVVFTNKRVTGPIRITKQLFSAATADQDKEFLIAVRLDDASINTKADDGVHGKVADGDQQLVFTNGIANVRLKSGEYASITNLPTGVKYSVNEENAAGYEAIQAKMVNGVEQETTGGNDISSLGVVMHEIEPEGSDTKVVIKENNTRERGSFIINKEFAPTGETGGDEKFTFEVQLYSTYVAEGDPANVKETGITTDPTAPDNANPPKKFGDLVFNEGKATVELSKDNNWRAEAKNIPTGLYYTVKEVMTDDQKENFRLVNGVGEIQSGQVINGARLVSFTNERIYKGDLAVRKELAYPDLDEDKDQEFTFKVTLYNDWTKATVAEDINKTYATISPTDKPLEFKNGVATVSLKHDERASASKLPEGMAYEVEELSNNALQGFAASTKYELYDGGTGTEDSKQVITKDRLAQATVTNTREVTNASIAKVWDEAGNTHADAKSMVPDSIDVNLMRSDNATEPYLTVTLNKENNWKATPETVPALGKLPLKAYNGNDYTYTWKEPGVNGWTLASTTYSKNGTQEQNKVTNVAGYLTTLTNTVDTGSIKVTKHFAKIDLGTLTADDLKQITFSVKNSEDTQIATNTLDQFVRENDGLAWTIEGLPIGTYTVTETNAHKKYSFETTYKVGEGTATTTPAKPVVVKGQTTAVDVTNTYIPDKPGFDKKIQDINDTTGQTSDWQDSADYDIGDSVPYRLTATLAKDVTAYKKYHITFTDKMEESLDYNKDALITVTGADGKVVDPSTYTVEKVAENAHDFAYKLTWGDGKALISNENLNSAKVEVRFTATLNSNAKLGKEGNVNACKLAYSNNPTSVDDKDEGELPWDYVIAFTYKLDVNKVDADANALEGAKFKLEKKLSNDTLQEIALTTTKNVFTAIGVDDGTYILTETEAPSGYDLIDPIEFTVTADHNVTWDYTSDPSADPKFDGTGRTNILSALTGKTETGELELKADEQLQGLAGNVVNKTESPVTIAVRKTVSSSRSEDKTKSFGFKVTLYKDQKHTKVADDLTGTYGDMEFKKGVATFNLKDNQTKTAKDLPLYDNGELGYIVEETNSGGLTSNLKETKGKDGVSTTITCTNTYTASKSGSSTTSSGSSTGGSLATTGDTTNNAGVVALLATGALGILAGALCRRRRQQQ